MSFAENIEFLTRINVSVKEITKDGKADKSIIPQIVLLITDLLSSGKKRDIVTDEQLTKNITSLYEYIMEHYNLFPADDLQKAEFKTLFGVCIKLTLFQPHIANTKDTKSGSKYFGRKYDVN